MAASEMMGEDLRCGLETDDGHEGRDGVLAVGRNEFGNFMFRHALFLNGCVGQLFDEVVRHLNDHSDQIRHAGLLPS